MPYARINMAEFASPEEAERTISILRNDIKSVFPEIRAFACVETSDASALTISIYDDKEAADRAVSQRDKHHEDKNLAGLFTHEGDLRCFYVEAEHIEDLLKSGP